jgi:hypothetical protein
MSGYVGIDVHRKRSQAAVVTEDGTVELNKNVMSGSEPMLRAAKLLAVHPPAGHRLATLISSLTSGWEALGSIAWWERARYWTSWN